MPNPYQMSEQAAYGPSEQHERKGDGEYKENEYQDGSRTLAMKEEMTFQDPPRETHDDDDENKELQRKIRNGSLDHLFEKVVITSEESKSNFVETAQLHERVGGIDFVPAFRSRGWPKVSRDWIKRDRKWPSPEMVSRVIQEGYHLVVKSPKNNGNPDCDFKLSFSHAEYLLSQEMNDIQRERYRCLKKYYCVHLSTQPASLVSFHLKNLLLQTIEETGDEMWTESNRVECMMMLLGNLLEALTKKDLRHFFVRSYNLFGVDYIEDPKSLESLAKKVEEIMENLLHLYKDLINSQKDPSTNQNPEQQHKGAEETPAEGIADIERERNKSTVKVQQTEAAQTNSLRVYRFHYVKEIYLGICKELIDMAFNAPDSTIENLDSLERSLVQDLREIVHNHNVDDLPGSFNISWDMAYYKIWISTEPDMRRRMLVGIQGQVQLMKYMLKQGNVAPDDKMAILRMFDPSASDPFDLNHIMPADAVTQFLHRMSSSVQSRPAHKQKIDIDGIPLD